MQFQPKSEEELQESGLWEPGTYGFEVLEQVTLGTQTYSTRDGTSKGGNEMIVLILKVTNADGHFITVIDYLLEKIAYKLRHAAVACDLEQKYHSGQLHATDFIGRTGKLNLRIEKDSKGEYPPKNSVKDYVTESKPGKLTEEHKEILYSDGEKKVDKAKKEDVLDDEVPF